MEGYVSTLFRDRNTDKEEINRRSMSELSYDTESSTCIADAVGYVRSYCVEINPTGKPNGTDDLLIYYIHKRRITCSLRSSYSSRIIFF